MRSLSANEAQDFTGSLNLASLVNRLHRFDSWSSEDAKRGAEAFRQLLILLVMHDDQEEIAIPLGLDEVVHAAVLDCAFWEYISRSVREAVECSNFIESIYHKMKIPPIEPPVTDQDIEKTVERATTFFGSENLDSRFWTKGGSQKACVLAWNKSYEPHNAPLIC